MAGRDTVNGSASFVTEDSPCANRTRIARRVGSARAEKVVLSALEEYLTIWLSICLDRNLLKHEIRTSGLL